MARQTGAGGGRLGIIGGSGLYRMAALEDGTWQTVETPWGEPSDQLLTGRIAGREVVFLPRHGRKHHLAPSELNHRANIAAMKALGVTEILSLSACGSFREYLPPGAFVIVDQFIDRTQGRTRSFFGEGVVAHVSMAEPLCGRLGEIAAEACEALGILRQKGGTYLCIEGPQFSTRAESRLYREVGADVIGMTNLPEAYLAREAEICYQSIAMVTDFDSWHDEHDAVEMTDVVKVLAENSRLAQELVVNVVSRLPQTGAACPEGCDRALEHAIMTPLSAWPEATRARLKGIAARVLEARK
ncbi:MAG TPA: S-methyl-5'-thioadenosine phosphorylase [Pedomonas sp.]|nr:S-methyl-5'-thioadenosine phosphorylase [Pedomonas sp.]